MLPRLAFSHAQAGRDIDLTLTRSVMESTLPGLTALDALCPPRKFRSLAAPVISFDKLRISAAAHDPLFLERQDAPTGTLSLSLPLFGSVEYAIGNKLLIAHAGHSAALLSGAARQSKTTRLSHVLIAFDEARLQSTLSSMLGHPTDSIKLQLNDQLLQMKQHGIDFFTYLQNIFSMMDSLPSQEAMRQLALDDQIYRTLARLIAADRFATTSQRRPDLIGKRKLDSLCEHILANLEQPLVMTSLERVAGMSTRTLQYVFLQRYNCTPTQWIREQRLLRARKLLETSGSLEPITALAIRLGFSSHSMFSRCYRERFGELPSETRQRLG